MREEAGKSAGYIRNAMENHHSWALNPENSAFPGISLSNRKTLLASSFLNLGWGMMQIHWNVLPIDRSAN
jgi:hypothetical protein